MPAVGQKTTLTEKSKKRPAISIMEEKNNPHFNNIMILVLLLAVVFLLGYASLKNQIATQKPSLVFNKSSTSPTPFSIIIETPAPSQSPVSELTLEEAQQEKPPPPSALTTFVTPNGLNLQWKAIRGDILSYNIYRFEAGNDFKKIATQPANKTIELKENGTYVFTDKTVVIDKTYTYAITAVNIFQNESDRSESATITAAEFPF